MEQGLAVDMFEAADSCSASTPPFLQDSSKIRSHACVELGFHRDVPAGILDPLSHAGIYSEGLDFREDME